MVDNILWRACKLGTMLLLTQYLLSLCVQLLGVWSKYLKECAVLLFLFRVECCCHGKLYAIICIIIGIQTFHCVSERIEVTQTHQVWIIDDIGKWEENVQKKRKRKSRRKKSENWIIQDAECLWLYAVLWLHFAIFTTSYMLKLNYSFNKSNMPIFIHLFNTPGRLTVSLCVDHKHKNGLSRPFPLHGKFFFSSFKLHFIHLLMTFSIKIYFCPSTMENSRWAQLYLFMCVFAGEQMWLNIKLFDFSILWKKKGKSTIKLFIRWNELAITFSDRYFLFSSFLLIYSWTKNVYSIFKFNTKNSLSFVE